MKNYTFHWELKNLIIQFMGALDESIVKRYDENKDVEKEVDVRFVYAPKSRTMHWLVNKQQHITLPVVSCWIGSVTRDNSRVFNKIDGPIYIDQETSQPLQPVPVDITMNISMLAKYQNDMDQMVSNFVPYFDPYIILSWQHPTVDREIRSEVTWGGSLNYNYPTDIAANESYRIGVDTSFTIKGWLFKKAGGSVGEIHTVVSNYYGVGSGDSYPFEDDLDFDQFITSGIPVIERTDPVWASVDGSDITAYGNLLSIDNVYISGESAMVSGMELVDIFSDEPNLSGDNPPFYGREISTWVKDPDGSIVNITIPALGTTGFLDIIILNSAGYGGIIKNSEITSPQKDGLFII